MTTTSFSGLRNGRSLEAMEFATLEWVDWFNHRRLFEPIGDLPPAETKRATIRRSQRPESHNSLSEMSGDSGMPKGDFGRNSNWDIARSRWIAQLDGADRSDGNSNQLQSAFHNEY